MSSKVCISTVDFLVFDFNGANTKGGEFPLECNFNLSSQAPNDDTLLKRAILVDFRARSQTEQFHLNVLCRVVFDFESTDDLMSGKELIRLHKKDALSEMFEQTNRVLVAMGKNKLELPPVY